MWIADECEEWLAPNVEKHSRDEYHGSPGLLLRHDQSASRITFQIGTHADSLIAEAVLKNITYGFDLELAWEAVWKDTIFGPIGDGEVQYADREEVCFEP